MGTWVLWSWRLICSAVWMGFLSFPRESFRFDLFAAGMAELFSSVGGSRLKERLDSRESEKI